MIGVRSHFPVLVFEVAGGGVMAQSLGGRVDELVRALRAFEPGEYSGEDCARLVTTFSRAEKALAAARVRAAARSAESNQHRREGFADPSEWLSRLTGGTARDARNQLDTMKRLELCPATRDAVNSGEVSLGQADEIARTEDEVPGSEAILLPLAKKSGLSKVRDEARKKRANAIPAEELHNRQRAARSVRHWRDELGMIAGTFRLTPEVGVPFVNRLEREAQRLRRAAKQRGGTVERFEAFAADAFADMIQGSPTSAPAKSRRRDVDAVIVCDLRAYRRGHAHEGEQCHLVGGGPIPVSLAREMAKDAFLKAVLHDGVHIHTVKHFGRHIPAELRTALEVGPLPDLDGVTCSEEGCERRYGLEWDHDNPVANGGETSYENLRPKCEPHHWDKTERDRRAGRHGGRPREPRPPPRE
jgi:hypothetical protein